MSPSYTIYMDRFSGLLKPRFVTQDPDLLAFAEKDYAYCLRRFSGEGIRFLTVTLPELRKAVDLSLKTGHLEVPKSFQKCKGTGIPVFLSSHFRKIYESNGVLKPNCDISALSHVRQVLEVYYKLQIPYSPAVEAETLDKFVQNEQEVRNFVSNTLMKWQRPDLLGVTRAAYLCYKVFEGFDYADIIPGNGPGKLSTGEVGDQKWITSTKIEKLHQVYPYYKYFYHSTNMLGDLRGEYLGLKSVPEGTSKVKLVPKDSRGPRIITVEPHGNMWIQQGLRVKMSDWLENRSALTKGHINFTDQTINQDLALSSSLTGEWATLDLKDASDLLSVEVVKLIFRMKPKLLSALLACRTEETVLPNGKVMRLKKFAGMGSATCFPVEAFCFWALSVSAISAKYNMSLQNASSLAYVYGDDIIVPVEYVEDVIVALEDVGLKVNTSKSYYTGCFRESCGVEAFFGSDITPIRIKKQFPVTSKEGEALAAWCSYANAFARRGYDMLAATIFRDLGKVFGTIPFGVATSPFPCRIVEDKTEAGALNLRAGIRWRPSSRYQRLEWKVFFLTPDGVPSELDGWNRLTRNLIAGTGDDPSQVTLPNTVKTVRGWAPI